MNKRTLVSSLQLVLAFLGTGIAGTLYYADSNSIQLPCSTSGGCDLVRASHWSHLYGIPVTLLGLSCYITLALLSVVKLTADSPLIKINLSRLILLIALIGTAYSWYLQYVAYVDIGAFCIWCRCSAITMTLLFLSAVYDQLLNSNNTVGSYSELISKQ